MAQTPQVSSQSALAPLPASKGKVPKQQTSDEETFASLLEGKGVDLEGAPAGNSARPAGVGQAADVQPGGNGAGKKRPPAQVGEGGGELRAPAVTFHPSERVPAPSGDAITADAGAKTGSSRDEDAPETGTPANTAPSNVNGGFALLATQFQAAAPMILAQAQTGGPKEPAGSIQDSPRAPLKAAGMGGQAALRAVVQLQLRASAAPLEVASQTAITAAPGNASPAGEGQAGSGSTLAVEASSSAIAQSQSVSSPALKLNTPAFAVTDVRTHLAPAKLAIKSPALESAVPNAAATLADSLGAAEAAPGAGQAFKPVSVLAGSSAHHGRSGGEMPGQDAASRQPAQSVEPSAAPAVSSLSQGAPSPAQQVFDAIKPALSAAAGGASAAQSGNPASAAAYEPVKTITIALQPEGLGAVSIQLSLKNSQLGLRLEASEASAAQLLRQNGDDLTGLLQSAGYAVGSIVVHAAPQAAQGELPAQAGQNGQNNAFNPPSNAGGGNAGGGSAGGGGAGGGSAGAGSGRQPAGGNEQEGGHGRHSGANRDPSLYV